MPHLFRRATRGWPSWATSFTLGGTETQVQSASIRLRQTTLASPDPFTASVTLSLYSVNVTTLATSLITSSTSLLDIGSTGNYQLDFSFANVTVPGTLYYGISATSASPSLSGLQVALWDYWPSPAGDGPLLAGGDLGTVFNSPTNVSTVAYGRLASNPGTLVASTGGGPRHQFAEPGVHAQHPDQRGA